MQEQFINREFGRIAFGHDPENYHTARPTYPNWVFDMLRMRCCNPRGSATFEIGAGTGLATQGLLNIGAGPLIAIEPDIRLANYLINTLKHKGLTVIPVTFEDAELPANTFDLGVSATAFHWVDEVTALQKVAKLLRPGGWWVMIWNIFGDEERTDTFHEATNILLNGPQNLSAGLNKISFGLDVESRVAALGRAGFDSIEHKASTWEIVLNPKQIVALYATFSNINIRSDRDAILGELERIASEEFNGLVTRNMSTILYMARRSF